MVLADRSVASLILKVCFSCGEDSGQVPKGTSQAFAYIFLRTYEMNSRLVF